MSERNLVKHQAMELHPIHFNLWNQFVEASPQGDVFCYAWWLDAITKGNFKILVILDKDEIVAGIPLAYYFGKINEPPLTRTLGPLFKNLDHLDEHDRITQQRKWLNALLVKIPMDEFEQFCTSHNFNDWLPFRWRGLKQTTRYTYLIDYSQTAEIDLWKKLSRNRQRMVLRAGKEGIHCVKTNSLQQFYALELMTYKRQGLKFRLAFDDFKRLDEAIQKNGHRRIITAIDKNGVPHAAIYLAFNRNSVYALLSGSDPQFRHLGGHTLVMWEAIKYFHGKVKYFNFGGSDIERIETHLRGFGGKLHQYFHIYKEHPLIKEIQVVKEIQVIKEIAVAAPPCADDWLYHTGRILHHIKILILKTLYKLHIRFSNKNPR